MIPFTDTVYKDIGNQYVAHFENARYLATVNLETTFTPKQNVDTKVISGYTECLTERWGKNFLPIPYVSQTGDYNGLYITAQDDGSLTLNGKDTVNDIGTFYFGNSLNTFALPVGWYILSVKCERPVYIELYRDGVFYKKTNANIPFENDSEFRTYNCVLKYYGNTEYDNVPVYPQIEYGKEATDFTKYTHKTFTTSFNQTIYGGMLNVRTGLLRKTFDIITIDGTETSISSVTSAGAFYVQDSKIDNFAKTVRFRDLCDVYTPVEASSTSGMPDKTISRHSLASQRLYIKDTSLANMTESTLRSYLALHPIKYCGYLNNRENIQLSAQSLTSLAGYNNYAVSVGKIEALRYRVSDKGVFHDFCEAIESEKTKHLRVTFLVDNVVFEDSDFSANGNCALTTYMNPEIDLSFGTAFMSEISLSFLRSDKTDQLNWTREFKVEFGVEYNGSIQWIQVGIFAGKRPLNTHNDEIKFTAYDRMRRFDKDVGDFMSLLSFPCSLQDVYDELCAFVGITNEAGDEISDVMDRTFSSAFSLTGISTCRDLLSKIAEANCCYAKATTDGKVKLVWFADHSADYKLMRDNIFTIESTDLATVAGYRWDDLENKTWDWMENLQWDELYSRNSPLVYDGIMASWDNESPVVYPPDAAQTAKLFHMENNPFVYYASTADVETHLSYIMTRLDLFVVYYVANITSVGNWMVEPGDIISLEKEDGTFTNYPIFSRVVVWNGSCGCEYESTGNLSGNE